MRKVSDLLIKESTIRHCITMGILTALVLFVVLLIFYGKLMTDGARPFIEGVFLAFLNALTVIIAYYFNHMKRDKPDNGLNDNTTTRERKNDTETN